MSFGHKIGLLENGVSQSIKCYYKIFIDLSFGLFFIGFLALTILIFIIIKT